MDVRLIECSYERHAGAILEILNEAIVSSTALYDYQPRTAGSMQGWFDTKRAGLASRGAYPVIGAEDSSGQLLGFASYGMFRAWPAYKYSVEHSVYIHRAHRGKGLGRALMTALAGRAREQGYHTLIGAIDSSNEASIRLHEQLGFTRGGTLRQAGYKFGRWLDVVFYQLLLDTPAAPQDGDP
jgi:phosphinothricin acetyltransferase